MANTIDMKDMRYLNLFEKITRIKTIHVFEYNETIFFCVPKELLSRALGKDASNLRRMSEIIRRKIKIVPIPMGVHHARDFFRVIVDPITFKDFTITNNEIIVIAPKQSKASLIGRNKRRLEEMKKIMKSFFGKEFRIA